MDLDLINRWLGSIALVISIVSAIGVFLGKPGRELATKLEALGKEVRDALKGHDRRIQAVENEIKHLPTSDEFAQLQNTVTQVQGDTKRIEETLGMVRHTVERIDDWLRATK